MNFITIFFMQINKKFDKGTNALDLTDTVELTDDQLVHVLQNTAYLNLTRCRKLTDSFIKELSKNLQHLTLRHLTKVTGKEFSRLPTCLKTLDLTGCFNFKGENIRHIPRALSELNIEGCYKVSDKHVKDLPPELTVFTYSHKCPYFAPCGNITLQGLADLPETIRSVTIKRCGMHNTQYPGIFPSGVVKSISSPPSLNPKERNSPHEFS